MTVLGGGGVALVLRRALWYGEQIIDPSLMLWKRFTILLRNTCQHVTWHVLTETGYS